MFKAVLFDLDETLILRAGAIRAFIADQYQRYAARLGGIDKATYSSRFLGMEDNGRIPKDKVYPAFVQALGIAGVPADELLADYRARYANFAVLAPGAIDTIKAIRHRGLKTGMVTNGNVQVQQLKLEKTGLAPLMETIVISEAVGLKKPDPAIFDLATTRLGVAPPEAIYVGDSPQTDIVGAIGAGLGAVWFRNPPDWPDNLTPRATVEIDRLPQLLDFLAG